jgi:O-antigen/teichoic acid export membrane protein
MLTKIRQSKGLQLSLITIASSVSASALAAVAVILISRLLGPSNFAYFSAAFSLSLILNRLNDFGLVTVIQKYVGGEFRKNKINKYLSLCLRYRLIISVIISSLGLIFSKQIADFLQIDSTWLIPITFIASLAPTYFESSQATLQSLGQFKLAAYNYVLPAIIKTSLVVLVFVMKIDNVELILAIYLLSTLPSILIAERKKKSWVKYDLESKFLKEKSKLMALLKHSSFAIIAAGLIENIDIIFAKHYLSDFETGLLGGINRIAMLLYVISYSLANVLNPRVAKYKHKEHMDAFIKKSWGIVALFNFATNSLPNQV